MKEFEKGQKVKVKFNLSPSRPVELNCRIENTEYDRLILDYPDDRAFLKKYIHEGLNIEVLTYTEKGIYCFDSIVIESPLSGNFTIEFPEAKIKVQRREYVRIPFKIALFLNKEHSQMKGETVNIGGGGLRFTTTTQLTNEESLSFNMILPRSEDFIKGTGTVLYSNEQGKNFLSVLKFTEIEESDRNKIIRACFEEEARLIKKRTDQ